MQKSSVLKVVLHGPKEHMLAGIVSGKITAKKINAEFEVNIEGHFKPLNINSYTFCDEYDFNEIFHVEEIEFKNLSTRQGKAGKHVYNETY